VGGKQLRLQAHHRGVPRGDVRDRLDPAGALDRDRGHQRVRAGAGHRVVVDVDEADPTGVLERLRDREHRVVRAALGRVELDGGDPLSGAELAGELGLCRPLVRGDDELALRRCKRNGRLPLLLDGPRDRGDLGRRRAAAAADHARAERTRLRRELGEVLGRGVGVDDPAAREAGEADVGERRERPAVAHCLEGGKRGVQASTVVRADGGEVVVRKLRDSVGCRDAAEGLGVLVEGEHGDDRQARDALHRLDRRLQLVEVEEGLDHEEVDAAPVQERRLLGEDRAPLVRVELAELAERANRAGYVDVAS